MAKRNSEIKEYMGQWDDGTYQTGAIHPPKPSSGLVAFLLVTVIFLGGICSALGILNIRLLQQLSQMDRETTPLSLDSQPQLPTQNHYLEELEIPEPQVPEQRSVDLHILQSPYFSPQNQSVLTAQQIYQRNESSMVQVQCLTHFGAVHSGVGLVLSEDGYILINNHVVDAAKRIFVTLSDGTLLRATLVGSDSFSDLAVLYIEATDLNIAIFSNNKALQVTDPSFAISSVGQTPHIFDSSVFSVARTLSTKSSSLTLIQTCQGGASGPVFDSFGNVMGFQTGHIQQFFGSADIKGTGLVIPTNTIRQIVSQLVQYGHVDGRPGLGIEVEPISKVYQQYWQLPDGLLLTGVRQSSNAALCGLEEGDILLALDGIPVRSRSDLYATLHNHSVGDVVIAVISRDGQKFTVKLTIEENRKH